MGTQKVLLPFGERTILQAIIEACVLAGLRDIIVVTGHQPDPVETAVRPLPCRTAHNANYQQGMLSSIRCGVDALPPGAAGFLLFLGDQPELSPGVVQAVHGALEADPDAIVLPVFNGRRGHPVGIGARFREAILSRYDDVGLRGLMQEYADAVRTVAVEDAGVLMDLDTPEEYEAALRRYRL
ncbi:MAG: nucleotidyltransferase family protein [Candidatus Hydrogenedentes bacterium]|nr:nucleotidyltransferase family protein [Candidatus Hydrogenedentota bacterium]